MTRDEFKILVMGMKAVYTDPRFIPDQNSFDVWYGLLKDYSYEIANMAVEAYMMREEAPPMPAHIRKYVAEITAPVENSLTELEAWALVERAIKNGIYGSQKEFDKLPPLVQRAVGSASRIHEMAHAYGNERNYEKYDFLKCYRALVEQDRRERELSTPLRSAIAQTRRDIPQIDILDEGVKS